MTPKDTPYKLRQQEFRKLNRRTWKSGEHVHNEPIVHAKKYYGVKETTKED